ncbi:hypothetical protein ACVI3S_003467 [Bradyrhizobium diazoefficiens]
MKKQVSPSSACAQHQERVAHRRRHEPFVAGDAIGVAVTHRARHVGAHIGATLLLGHADAERHAALAPPRRKRRVVALRRQHRHHARQQIRLRRQRGDGGARHRDWTEMAGLDLRGDVEFCGADDLGGIARRLPVRRPGRIVHAGMRAVRHQLVIGGMKLDLVAAIALGVEGAQLGRVLIRHAPAIGHRGRAPVLAEFGQLPLRLSAAIGLDRLDQRPVHGEQIDIPKQRRLVEDLVGCEAGLSHLVSPARNQFRRGWIGKS